MSTDGKSLLLLASEYRNFASEVESKLAMTDTEDEEAVKTILSTLDEERFPMEQKAAGIALYAKKCDVLVKQIDEQIKSLQARKKMINGRQSRMTDYLVYCMQAAGIKKIECADLSISVQKNKPKVDVYDEALLPREYMRLPPIPAPVPDKIKIGDDLKEGVVIQGARLIQEERIVIK